MMVTGQRTAPLESNMRLTIPFFKSPPPGLKGLTLRPFSRHNAPYVGWSTSFMSFSENGWTTRPCLDEDDWLFDAPCDSAQNRAGVPI